MRRGDRQNRRPGTLASERRSVFTSQAKIPGVSRGGQRRPGLNLSHHRIAAAIAARCAPGLRPEFRHVLFTARWYATGRRSQHGLHASISAFTPGVPQPGHGCGGGSALTAWIIPAVHHRPRTCSSHCAAAAAILGAGVPRHRPHEHHATARVPSTAQSGTCPPTEHTGHSRLMSRLRIHRPKFFSPDMCAAISISASHSGFPHGRIVVPARSRSAVTVRAAHARRAGRWWSACRRRRAVRGVRR